MRITILPTHKWDATIYPIYHSMILIPGQRHKSWPGSILVHVTIRNTASFHFKKVYFFTTQATTSYVIYISPIPHTNSLWFFLYYSPFGDSAATDDDNDDGRTTDDGRRRFFFLLWLLLSFRLILFWFFKIKSWKIIKHMVFFFFPLWQETFSDAGDGDEGRGDHLGPFGIIFGSF